MKRPREFVEVIAEEIRAVIVEDHRKDFAKLRELLRKRKFTGLRERHRSVGCWMFRAWSHRRRIDPALPKNRSNPHVAVLQIRRGVALKAQHFVPRKT